MSKEQQNPAKQNNNPKGNMKGKFYFLQNTTHVHGGEKHLFNKGDLCPAEMEKEMVEQNLVGQKRDVPRDPSEIIHNVSIEELPTPEKLNNGEAATKSEES